MQQIMNNSFAYDQSTIFYNMVGNFIPPEWQRLSHPSGKILSKTSRQLLSLIVSCFESSANHTAHANELQESYYFFEQQLGVCQRRIRQCFVELQQAGFLTLELLTVIKHHIKCRNILSIKLLKDFKNIRAGDGRSNRPLSKLATEEQVLGVFGAEDRSVLNNVHEDLSTGTTTQLPSGVEFGKRSNVKKFPADLKKLSAQGEENFRLERKNFQPHNIIDNNISIYKSRSTESDFVNFSKDDFSSSGDQEKFEQNQDKNDDGHQDPPQGNSSNWLTKVATKAKNFCGLKKKLAEFHPLSDDDAWLLQMRSGREFNLNFINQLLLKLSTKYPDRSFPNRTSVLNYMTKALTYELRDAYKVNNEGFKFKQDQDIKAREEYLQKVECSQDTRTTSQFRRKIAAVFEPQLAYELLTSCSFADPQGDCYNLKLIKDFAVSNHVKEVLLKEAKAVYGSSLERLEIIPCTATSNNFANKNAATETVDNYAHLQGIDSESVWFKVRKYLVEACGIHIDKSWFSKLEVVDEDVSSKKIVLKPQSSFIGYWINQNYQTVLERAFVSQNFSFEITKY